MRLFEIKLTGSTSPGPYTIYDDIINPGSISELYPSGLLAENLSLSDLQTGITIVIENDVNKIIIYNQYCDTFLEYNINPLIEGSGCICLTILASSDFDIECYSAESYYQYYLCNTGDTYNDRPIYSDFSGNTIYWKGSYWEFSGDTPYPVIFRSTNQTNKPLTNWLGYGTEGDEFLVYAIEGDCEDGINSQIVVIKQDPECIERKNGSISIVGYGGTSPWEYSLDGINYKPIGLFLNLGIGNYVVYGRDDNGNVLSKNVTLSSNRYCTTNRNDPEIGI